MPFTRRTMLWAREVLGTGSQAQGTHPRNGPVPGVRGTSPGAGTSDGEVLCGLRLQQSKGCKWHFPLGHPAARLPEGQESACSSLASQGPGGTPPRPGHQHPLFEDPL